MLPELVVERQSANAKFIKPTPPTSPKNRKRPKTTGGPGVDDPEKKKQKGRGKGKQSKEDVMTLARAVMLSHTTVSKYSARELQEVKKLYENEFHGLHIFGRHPYKEDDNKTDMQVDIAFLHRA
jgi:transglutaminase/protease-like cytokinesis protein 3